MSGDLSSEPGSPEHRQWCLARLQHALQRIALEPVEQIAQFPSIVVVADELALDLDHWTEVCRAWEYVEGKFDERLGKIDALLGGMSGPEQAERWTPEALVSDLGWQRARDMAREALRVAGWPQEVPPTPEDEGTAFVDGTLPDPPFRVICIDDHTFLFQSRTAMLVFNERMAAGQEKPGDRCGDLTIGKFYEVTEIDGGMYRVIDDSGEDYLYPASKFRRVSDAG